MGQPKVIVAVAATVVLTIAAFLAGQPLVAVLVLVLGAGGTVFLVRQSGATLERPGKGRDDFLEADEPPATTSRDTGLSTWDAPAAEPLGTWDAPAAEPLGTWDAPAETESLGTWDAPAETDGLATWDAPAEAEPLATWDTEPLVTWDESTDTVVADEDEIALASSLVSTPINEDVSSADDIMAASTATELHLDDEGPAGGEDSELAKLLAKVQARLAAYE